MYFSECDLFKAPVTQDIRNIIMNAASIGIRVCCTSVDILFVDIL